jgi:hypothetical protein
MHLVNANATCLTTQAQYIHTTGRGKTWRATEGKSERTIAKNNIDDGPNQKEIVSHSSERLEEDADEQQCKIM